MLRVGLTGGIGSGKSTVAQFFAARGTPVIDTDEIARELVRPGEPAHTEIVRQFGTEVLEPGGALNRAKMRTRVFDDPSQRRQLEAILHPRIQAEVERRTAALAAPYIIVAVPLLIETGYGDIVDRVLVVDCEELLQLQRVQARSGLTPDEIRRIMDTQASRTQRLAQADDVIENNGDLFQLEQQVLQLHQYYLELART